MSAPFCYTYTQRRLVPGTGITVQAVDDNWDATAISGLAVDPGRPWEYSFIPRLASVFISGLFSNQIDPTPRIANYVFGVSFELFEFAPIVNGVKLPFTRSWSNGQTIKLVSTDQKYLIFTNGVERWWTWK